MPRKVLEDRLKEITKDESKTFEELVKEFHPEETNKYMYEKWNGIEGGTDSIFDDVYKGHIKYASENKLHEGSGRESQAKILEHLILSALKATKQSNAVAAASVFEETKKGGHYKTIDDQIEELKRLAHDHLGIDEKTLAQLGETLENSTDKLYKRQVIKDFTNKLKDSVISHYRGKKLSAKISGKEFKFNAYLVKHNEELGAKPKSYGRELLKSTAELLGTTKTYMDEIYQKKLKDELRGYMKKAA
jgi:hypothetical protein